MLHYTRNLIKTRCNNTSSHESKMNHTIYMIFIDTNSMNEIILSESFEIDSNRDIFDKELPLYTKLSEITNEFNLSVNSGDVNHLDIVIFEAANPMPMSIFGEPTYSFYTHNVLELIDFVNTPLYINSDTQICFNVYKNI